VFCVEIYLHPQHPVDLPLAPVEEVVAVEVGVVVVEGVIRPYLFS
jgi:hypothetical protein